MAQRNLLAAADAVERHPERAAELAVDDEETAGWRDAADAMSSPMTSALAVHAQAEGFTEHQTWDFEHTPPSSTRCCCTSPTSTCTASRSSSRPISCCACTCCGDAFTAEEKARNFAYYERLTVRDSSLSACTQAVIAAEVGHLEFALDYLSEAALIDLDDIDHNTRDGLHVAALAGTWIAAVAGFGGMRDHNGSLSFAPRLPQALSRIAFRLCFAGRSLLVDAGHTKATYALLDGDPLEIFHHGRRATLTAQRPLTRSIPRAKHPGEPPPPAGGTRPLKATSEHRHRRHGMRLGRLLVRRV